MHRVLSISLQKKNLQSSVKTYSELSRSLRRIICNQLSKCTESFLKVYNRKAYNQLSECAKSFLEVDQRIVYNQQWEWTENPLEV